jgi:1-acyl-sn-glycerol-3-phosphate acyltransferase
VLLHLDALVVAKAEVKKWPLVGFGANLVGTLFVKREEKSSRQVTANAIRAALEQKESVLVFPEGTTTAGPLTIDFRPRSFQAAEEAGVPVQPMAIYYDSPDMPFIGDDTFLPHFFRVFRKKYITGRIAFGPLLYGPGTADQARAWIDQQQTLHHAQVTGHDRS